MDHIVYVHIVTAFLRMTILFIKVQITSWGDENQIDRYLSLVGNQMHLIDFRRIRQWGHFFYEYGYLITYVDRSSAGNVDRRPFVRQAMSTVDSSSGGQVRPSSAKFQRRLASSTKHFGPHPSRSHSFWVRAPICSGFGPFKPPLFQSLGLCVFLLLHSLFSFFFCSCRGTLTLSLDGSKNRSSTT